MNIVNMSFSFIAVLILFVAAPTSSYCTPQPAINAYFLNPIEAIKANQHFKLAIKFDIPSPWYIYAEDSGDIGVPTQVKLSIPEGFQQTHVQWSPFQKIRKAGNLSAQIYQNHATIVFSLIAPAALATNKSILFTAQVRWLACSVNQCIPMKKRLSLHLPQQQNQQILQIPKNESYLKNGNI